jgi:hypothetical protein
MRSAGTVAAADNWGEPVRFKAVNPGLPHSYEGLLHEAGLAHFALDLRSPQVAAALRGPMLERAIGVVYRWALTGRGWLGWRQLVGKTETAVPLHAVAQPDSQSGTAVHWLIVMQAQSVSGLWFRILLLG